MYDLLFIYVWGIQTVVAPRGAQKYNDDEWRRLIYYFISFLT